MRRACQLRGGQEQRVARGKKGEDAHSTGGALRESRKELDSWAGQGELILGYSRKG